MSPKTTVLLALAAGFAGGIVWQRIMPTPLYAQSPASVVTEVRAEKFVVVDHDGVPHGAFGIDKKEGWPTLETTDTKGRRAWALRGSGPLFGKGKPTIVPPQ